MRVAIAGATGALGRPLVRALHARGHEVVGLARSDANVAELRALGAEPRRVDLFDAASLAPALRGADAVVRAATHIPRRGKGTADDWAQNDRLRRDATRALLEAARRADVPAYLQESIVWLARPDDGAPFDERSPPRPDAVTRSAFDAERLAAEAAQHGVRAATLRLGWLYGAHTAHTRQLAEGLARRRQPIPGDGAAPLAFLHADDAAGAFAAALERRAEGVFHAVDDGPTPLADFLRAFASALGAPPPRRVPMLLARLAVGGWLTRFLTTPMRTSHDALTRATGWRPRYGRVEDGLAQVARELAG